MMKKKTRFEKKNRIRNLCTEISNIRGDERDSIIEGCRVRGEEGREEGEDKGKSNLSVAWLMRDAVR